MLAAEKENDPALKRSRWIAAVVLLFEGFTVWMLLTGVQKIVFYYDDRFAIPAKLMFWGNILFPAITLLWSGFWLIRKRKTGVSTLPDLVKDDSDRNRTSPFAFRDCWYAQF